MAGQLPPTSKHTYSITQSGFENVQGVTRFCTYNGKLYFGSHPFSYTFPEVYESSDNGFTWICIYNWESDGSNYNSKNVDGMAVINGKMYVAVGFPSYIWEYDGSKWERAADVRIGNPIGFPNSCYDMIVDGNTLYWIGDSIGTPQNLYSVYSSTDGKTWSPELFVPKATYSVCNGQTICVFNGDIYVACCVREKVSDPYYGRIFKKSAGVWDTGVAIADTDQWYGMCEFKGNLYCLGNSISTGFHWRLYKYDGSWDDGNLQSTYDPVRTHPRLFVSADGYLMATGPDHLVGGYNVAQVYYSADGADFSNLEDYNTENRNCRFDTAITISEGRTLIGGLGTPKGCIFYTGIDFVADFSATPAYGEDPLTVDFEDRTEGNPTSWDWDFGDSSPHSTEQNPTHVYNGPGTYTVTLIVRNDVSEATKTETDYITVYTSAPVADFSGTPTSGYDPLTVNFTDLSTGAPTAWSWNFGDPASGSSNTSTDKNPSHIFSAPGFYTITLTVTNENGTDTLVKTDYIESLLVAANFTGIPLAGTAPLTVEFSNTSTFPALTFFWDFGDGSIGSGATPSHTYTAPGSYTVTLTASHPDLGAYTATKVDYIVASIPVPVPAFSAIPIIGFEPSTVVFTNKSTGFPSAYLWDFGDGYTSIEKNPTHIYSLEGTYPVTLTVYNKAAPDGVISTPTDVIVLPVPNLVADYTTGSMIPNAGGIAVQFTDVSIGALTWSWDFGDPASGILNTSRVQNPSHVYSAVGTYQITLTVTHGTFSDSICKNILVTTDVLRYMEIWGTARFADGTQVAADRVVSVNSEITSTEYGCGSSATDTYHSYKTINDSGITRFLVRGRGNIVGIPDSGFEDGAPVYLFIGGRQATVELQNTVVPWSSPFFMTLPSDPTSSIEVDVIFPLVTTTIYPEPGIYEDRTEISFTNNILPLVVYYTLDGTDPKTSATCQLYTGPFYIEEGVTTIKYYSEDSLGPDEITREAVYVIHEPLVYASPKVGDYSTPLSVTLTGNRPGTIYYRLNHIGIYMVYQEPILLESGPTGVRTTFIEAYLVDEHAQVGATREFEYKIDLLNPVITSYTLSNGDPVTTHQMITVQVEASSYTNTVTGLLLSTYPDFHDTSVRLYQPEVVFTLPDPDGVKTVYAQVINQFGRISSIKSQTIELNTEIPVFTVSASPSEPIGETSYTFRGTKSADSGIYLIINGGIETLVIPFGPNTTWEHTVPLVEGINTLQFQAGTAVRNRSGIEIRTVDVRPIPQGVTQATTITGSDGTWRIPFVFFDEKTGEESTVDLNPPLRQHHNLKKRHHDFRIIVTSDSDPDPVVTFPTQDAVLTEKVITVTGTAEPGSKITLTVQRRGKVPA